MLLQSIFYGSFRFWLYFMVLPTNVIKLIEQDAKQILWATTPHIDSTEDGSPKCRRWITERASYLPLHEGGAGIMHWPSKSQSRDVFEDARAPTPNTERNTHAPDGTHFDS